MSELAGLTLRPKVPNSGLLRFVSVMEERFLGLSQTTDDLSSEPYHHKLLTTPRQIRVLELSGSTDRVSGLHCELVEVSLDAAPEYEALSYSWDAPSHPQLRIGLEAITPRDKKQNFMDRFDMYRSVQYRRTKCAGEADGGDLSGRKYGVDMAW